jgi:hypothetical protein
VLDALDFEVIFAEASDKEKRGAPGVGGYLPGSRRSDSEGAPTLNVLLDEVG